MKTLGALLLLELLGRAWCCSPLPGDTNIAVHGDATQSSTVIERYAYMANDGVKNLDWTKGSCTHTGYDLEPWWRLDMKQRYKVYVVVLGLRAEAYWESNMGMEVRIGDSPDNKNPVCGKITDISYSAVTFMCNGMEGQYVSVVIPGRNEFLSLCEVEVYGDLAS